MQKTLDFLQRNFGKAGSWYHEIARGQDWTGLSKPDHMRTKIIGIGDDLFQGLGRFRSQFKFEARRDSAMADDVSVQWCEKANARGRTVVTVENQMGRLSDFHSQPESREMTIQTREKLHQLTLVALFDRYFRCPKAFGSLA